MKFLNLFHVSSFVSCDFRLLLIFEDRTDRRWVVFTSHIPYESFNSSKSRQSRKTRKRYFLESNNSFYLYIFLFFCGLFWSRAFVSYFRGPFSLINVLKWQNSSQSKSAVILPLLRKNKDNANLIHLFHIYQQNGDVMEDPSSPTLPPSYHIHPKLFWLVKINKSIIYKVYIYLLFILN